MTPAVNRTAALINLAVFAGCAVFCIITQAPLIQQDILVRCRESLAAHQMPWQGLAVDGRDVTLTGPPHSAIVSAGTQELVGALPGVREVSVMTRPDPENETPGEGLEPGDSTGRRELQDKIDRVLENQGITFQTDSPLLTPEGEAVLGKIAVLLAESPSLRCEIRGYANQPKEARQLWVLALQRALGAEDYLVSKGIAEWRLAAHTFHAGFSAGARTARQVSGPVDIVVGAR